VAEDNDVNQIVVTEILTLAGFDCDVVASGRVAAQRALTGNYDLVLMDCQMPEMDGFAAAQLIRKTEAERSLESGISVRVPIVALTANAVKGDRQRCLDAGMDAYLSKPVDATALLEIMGALITQYDRIGEAAPASGLPSEEEPSAIAFDELLGRCVDNRLVAARVLEKFCDSAPRQLERIQVAMQRANTDELARAAHLLRGMAASVSAQRVAELAGRIESGALEGDCTAVDSSELNRSIASAVRAAGRWIADLRQDKAPSTVTG
jgi:Amt family ammonium transporter